MKLSVALRLGRISTLPTVASNVLAAVALADGRPSALRTVGVCLAMSMMYVAGMFLNDAFDREIDARDHPGRPIPSGEVKASAVFDAGFALLLGGIALTAIVALACGTGWPPILCAIALATLIIFYDADHEQNPRSPIVLALCRVGVYATAAFAVTRDVDPALVPGLVALLGYLVALSYVARQDSVAAAGKRWPLAILAVPLWLAFPVDLFSAVLYAIWIGATRRAILLFVHRRSREAVALLTASISLLDATLAANQGCTALAFLALAAFALTERLQHGARAS